MDFLFPAVILALLGWYLWWNRSALYVNAAHAAFRKGDETKTLEQFAKAEEAGRLNADITASYAYLLMKNDRTDEAAALLRLALTNGRRGKPLKEKDRRLLKTYLSLALRQQGELDDAIALLKSLHEEGYRTTALYGNLGFFLIEKGDLEAAEAFCTEAADWAPDGKVILDNLGTVHLLKQEWDKAAEVYAKLLDLAPRFPEAWWGAGRASFETGDLVEARSRWEKALTLPFNSLTTVDKAVIEKALSDLPS